MKPKFFKDSKPINLFLNPQIPYYYYYYRKPFAIYIVLTADEEQITNALNTFDVSNLKSFIP